MGSEMCIRDRTKIKKTKGENIVDNLPKVPAPAVPAVSATAHVTASNPQEPGSLVFDVLYKEFKDTVVPNALVKKGIVPDKPPCLKCAEAKISLSLIITCSMCLLIFPGDEEFNKDLMIVSNKYGFVIIGIQKGLLILSHRDLKR